MSQKKIEEFIKNVISNTQTQDGNANIDFSNQDFINDYNDIILIANLLDQMQDSIKVNLNISFAKEHINDCVSTILEVLGETLLNIQITVLNNGQQELFSSSNINNEQSLMGLDLTDDFS